MDYFEKSTEVQGPLPQEGSYLPPLSQVMAQMGEAPGEYANPVALSERYRLKLEWELLRLTELGRHSVLYQNRDLFLPLRWRSLFRFLHKNGVLQYETPTFYELYHDEPKLFAMRTRVQKLSSEETDGSIFPGDGVYSYGFSPDRDEAISKMIGELLERYALTKYKNRDLLVSSIRTMRRKQRKMLDPFLLEQFTEDQKKIEPLYAFDERSLFRWVRGFSLRDLRPAYIPAQLIFWNYTYGPGEPILQQPITNGAAGMFDKTRAILAALYELIQRDAFLLFWLNGIAPPRIRPQGFQNQRLKKLLRDCERYRLEVSILDTSTEFGVPCINVVLIDRSGKGAAVSMGGGSGLDVEEAILRALIEAVSIRYWERRNLDRHYDVPAGHKPFQDPSFGQVERLLYWRRDGMEKNIEFFLKGKEKQLSDFPMRRFPSKKDELQWLNDVFSAKGPAYEIFYYVSKDPLLTRLGYVSAKVVVPALLPLYLREIRAPWGKPRLKEVCRELGYEPSSSLNLLPHPFP